jgi:hypothetical protein
VEKHSWLCSDVYGRLWRTQALGIERRLSPWNMMYLKLSQAFVIFFLNVGYDGVMTSLYAAIPKVTSRLVCIDKFIQSLLGI